MHPEILSVREAREQLPRLLDSFRRGEQAPVFLGSHRKTEAVMLPVAVYEELVAQRQQAVNESTASLKVESAYPPAGMTLIVDRWVHGHITAEEMERQVAALYGVPDV